MAQTMNEYVFVFHNECSRNFVVTSFGETEEDALDQLYNRKRDLKGLTLDQVFLRSEDNLRVL